MYKRLKSLFLSLLFSFSRVSNPLRKDNLDGLTGKKYEAELKDEFLLGIVNGNLSKELLEKHYSIVKEIEDTKHVKYVKKTFSSFDEHNNLIKYNDYVPVLMDKEDIINYKDKKYSLLELENGYTLDHIYDPNTVQINKKSKFKAIIDIINHSYMVTLSHKENDKIIEFYCDSYDHSLLKHLDNSDKNICLDNLIDLDLFDKISIPFNLTNLIKDIHSFSLGSVEYTLLSFNSIKKNKNIEKNRFIIKFNVKDGSEY